MRAAAEGYGETVGVVGGRGGLVFDGRLVEGVTADGAGVGADVPGPHCDGVPFADLGGEEGRRISFVQRSFKDHRKRPQALERTSNLGGATLHFVSGASSILVCDGEATERRRGGEGLIVMC